ncbi:NAD(P)-dependent dehydrogenase (short-subunit alcohol dehydrogenase family) [Streptomyces sp. LBL]|jgi:NAD(P)-dependent dehydrogenase (short-subunit alcohol dehydrogenase family)|nr:hypothetical protein [Streptomyces sp. LBL]MDH6628632.1 NAD(P)-dependent dehydrogenase (short-subunit alcohol dehydrogenase family) [Streptomyces sp. LBL]
MTVTNAALTGKAAFVTGAGSGIGRATAVATGHALVVDSGQTV